MPYSDEAWYSLSGYVNSQNNRYWSIENPHAVHDVSLNDLRVGDWCAISVQEITRPMLFHKANTEHSETDSVILLLRSTLDHTGILCKIMQWYT
jgi:hypothetical protein